jgi:hypothetical protein
MELPIQYCASKQHGKHNMMGSVLLQGRNFMAKLGMLALGSALTPWKEAKV